MATASGSKEKAKCDMEVQTRCLQQFDKSLPVTHLIRKMLDEWKL